MATPQQVTNELQQKVLETVKVGQKGVVDFVRSWAETVEATYSKLSDLTFPEAPYGPISAFETASGFTREFLASQREFANQVFEAAVPATRAAPSAAQATRNAANAGAAKSS